MHTRPNLRLVSSRSAALVSRPCPEVRSAVAEAVATYWRWKELPPELGHAGIIHVVREYVRLVRGFQHPDDITAIVHEAFAIMRQRELAAMAAWRRPPRRRRPVRPQEAVQLQFEWAA